MCGTFGWLVAHSPAYGGITMAMASGAKRTRHKHKHVPVPAAAVPVPVPAEARQTRSRTAAPGAPLPLLVVVLAGNPATTAAVLTLLDTVDATALRRLHPAVAAAVSAVPWCDQITRVRNVVRWRAAFPAATGAWLARLGPTPAATAAALAGLTYLDVSEGCYESVTDDAIRLLPPTLQTLDLSTCIGMTNAASFAHLTALVTLNCSFTNVGKAAIATLPPSLQVLHAAHCCVSTGVDFRHLSALRTLDYRQFNTSVCGSCLPSSLEVIALERIDIEPDAAPLAHLAALRTLSLFCCPVPASVLASLPPSIEVLTLIECTGLAASSFPPLPALRRLRCKRTDISDATIATLPPSLTQLTVEKCAALTPAARLDHLVNLTMLTYSGTALAPSTLDACRARGCAIVGQ